MKKIVSLLLGLLMVFTACTAMAETVTAKPGDELSFDIYISNASGEYAKIGIKTNDSPVIFKGALGGSVNDVVPPSSFSGFFSIVADDGVTIAPDGGSISGNPAGPESLKDGKIGTLTFKVKTEAAPGTYTVEAYKVAGSVTVEGNITFIVEEETSDKLLGDVNGDGTVNGRDSVRLMKYLIAMDEEDPVTSVEIVEAISDVNQDGNINGRDSVRLMKMLIAMDEE